MFKKLEEDRWENVEKENIMERKVLKEEVKRIGLEVWHYIKINCKEIDKKTKLPKELFKELEKYQNECPFCDIFMKKDCKGCPLITCGKGSDYVLWVESENSAERKKYASRIYRKIKNWNIKGM